MFEQFDEFDNCETESPHMDTVQALSPKKISDEDAYSLAEFFKIFGDTTRIKIIQALTMKEICVCDIAELLGISQSNASHQLKILRQSNLVKPRKEGKMVYYSLTDHHVSDIFNEGLEHIKE